MLDVYQLYEFVVVINNFINNIITKNTSINKILFVIDLYTNMPCTVFMPPHNDIHSLSVYHTSF